MTLTGMTVLHAKSLLTVMVFVVMGMAAHFKELFGRPRPTEVALQVRENLRLPDDDDLENHKDWRGSVQECRARLGSLVESDEEPSADALDAAVRPVTHRAAKMRRADTGDDQDLRHEGDDTNDRTRRGDYLADGENGRRRGRLAPGRLSEEQMTMRRGVIAEGQTGHVVSHITK